MARYSRASIVLLTVTGMVGLAGVAPAAAEWRYTGSVSVSSAQYMGESASAVTAQVIVNASEYFGPGDHTYMVLQADSGELVPTDCASWEYDYDQTGDGEVECTFADTAVSRTYVAIIYTVVSWSYDPDTWEMIDVVREERARSQTFTTDFDPDQWEVDTLLSTLPALSVMNICDPILLVRPVELDFTSLPQPFVACERAVRMGLETAVVLTTVRPLLDRVHWYKWVCDLTGQWCSNVAPDYSPPTPPRFDPSNPQDGDYELPPNRPLWQILQIRNEELSATEAKMIADECTRLESQAMATGFSPVKYWSDSSACESLPIYVPGGNLEDATTHRVNAIEENPSRFQANYLNRTIREQSLSDKWYSNEPECQAREIGEACDEFPNFSTNQAGPGASLMAMESSINTREGSAYSGFLSACRLQSGTSANDYGDTFLVVPIPSLPMTTRVCGRNMRPESPAT